MASIDSHAFQPPLVLAGAGWCNRPIVDGDETFIQCAIDDGDVVRTSSVAVIVALAVVVRRLGTPIGFVHLDGPVDDLPNPLQPHKPSTQAAGNRRAVLSRVPVT